MNSTGISIRKKLSWVGDQVKGYAALPVFATSRGLQILWRKEVRRSFVKPTSKLPLKQVLVQQIPLGNVASQVTELDRQLAQIFPLNGRYVAGVKLRLRWRSGHKLAEVALRWR